MPLSSLYPNTVVTPLQLSGDPLLWGVWEALLTLMTSFAVTLITSITVTLITSVAVTLMTSVTVRLMTSVAVTL